VNYNKSAARVLVFPTATITDIDTVNFANATLTIQNTNGQATDTLRIVPTSLVTVSGSNVRYLGTVIGSFTGGTARTPLVFTFNNQTNAGRMQLVLQAIGFADSSSNPNLTSRSISVEATDGAGGKSTLQSKLVNVVAGSSAAPVVGSIGSTVNYIKSAARVLVFPTATITDVDTTLFTGGTLTVTNTNGQATDTLAIVPTSLVTLSGSNVLYLGTVIGSFTGGTATTPLVFTFNNQTNAGRLQLVLRAIGFADSSSMPVTTARSISVEVTDGVGGKSTLQSKLVNVVAGSSSAPVVGSIGSTVTYAENAPRVLVFSAATVTDTDTTLFTGGTLTVTNTNGQATDTLLIVPTSLVTVSGSNVLYLGTVIGSFTGGAAKTPLVFTFNNQTYAGRLQLVLRAIGFADSSSTPVTTARSITVEVTDDVGGKSVLQSKLVNVVA